MSKNRQLGLKQKMDSIKSVNHSNVKEKRRLETVCIVHTFKEEEQAEKAEILFDMIGIPTATFLRFNDGSTNNINHVLEFNTVFVPKHLELPIYAEDKFIAYDNLFDELPELVQQYEEYSTIKILKQIVEQGHIIDYFKPGMLGLLNESERDVQVKIRKDLEEILKWVELLINDAEPDSYQQGLLLFARYFIKLRCIDVAMSHNDKRYFVDIETVAPEIMDTLNEHIHMYSIRILQAKYAYKDWYNMISLVQSFIVDSFKVTPCKLLLVKSYSILSNYKKNHLEPYESYYFYTEAFKIDSMSLNILLSILQARVYDNINDEYLAMRRMAIPIMEKLYEENQYEFLSLYYLELIYKIVKIEQDKGQRKEEIPIFSVTAEKLEKEIDRRDNDCSDDFEYLCYDSLYGRIALEDRLYRYSPNEIPKEIETYKKHKSKFLSTNNLKRPF